MNEALHTLIGKATRMTRAGQLDEATSAIQRALGGVNPFADSWYLNSSTKVADSASVLDGCVFESDRHCRSRERDVMAEPYQHSSNLEGEFASANHSHGGLTRNYKLYTPPCVNRHGLGLVVMLHGCTQNPDDFATGTNMNTLAREQGFFVLYPEQSREANGQGCWNWFKHNHQRRGSGEPALIASLTQLVVRKHDIDPNRVYVAGLSAGGAMAAIVALTYPDVFAAVGVHSGLPMGAANNVAEALMLMKNGHTRLATLSEIPNMGHPVPAIVFHGDSDTTVHPRNGERVVESVLGSDTCSKESMQAASLLCTVEHGVSSRGRKYTRTTYTKNAGTPLVEHWVVHGAGHAWSGGMPSGSYTDESGPDASREMLRFFSSRLST